MAASPRIDLDRLLGRLDTFNRIGALPGGGNCRLALSDDDRAGRDLLVQWMRELGLAVTIDAIGNIIGVRAGREDTAAVMFGSHVDTVGTGGRYDGLYGVLAGLEACQALNDAGIATRRPLALVAFTNEEGSRFPPYAMGSLVYVGGLALEDAYAIRGIDGATVGEELRRIGYVGDAKPGWLTPHAYLELHIEQGPILEDEGLVIAAVEGITGLAWTEVAITGRASHAGTTPMHLRRDAAYAAAEIAVFARRLAQSMGGHQRATVGRIELYPNLVNVVAERAVLTVDLRNTDEARLREAEQQLAGCLDRLARAGAGRHLDAQPRPVRAGLVSGRDGGAGRSHGARTRPSLPPAPVRRRPRCANDGAALPGRHDLRAERRRAEPQRARTYQARASAGWRRRAAARGAAPRTLVWRI
jgi:beta-ureidopropionase / N-carbamoyl-L-amino-acid hydrolase